MNKNLFVILIASLTLVGCGTAASANMQPTLPFALVTVASNASATPTPFQPIPWTPTGSPSSGDSIQTPPPTDSVTQTATLPASTQTEIPTIDANILINTVAPLPTIDASGSQVLNNGQETVNFLLIGSDRRSVAGSTRTDTMVIAVLRPNDGQVSLISIPRDLWVSIPGYENNRVNTAYQLGISSGYPGGGSGLLKDTILHNLGIRIDHTAMVDFSGFSQIVDTLGGVDVPVSCAYTDWRLIDPSFDPFNEDNWHLYTTGPGMIHMDGDLALWYARSRQKSSDFDRGRRQQEVLRALFAQALQAGTLARIPELYNDLKSTVETDLGLADLLQLAVYAPKMTNADIRSYYIRPPFVSSWITDQGAYVLLPNEAELQQMLTEALSPSTKTVEKQSIIIDVMNGTSVAGYEALATSRLNYAGYETHIIPSDRQDYAYSVLIDKTVLQDTSISNPILDVMGMLQGIIISSPDPNSSAHYLLILGYDYEPCFSPEKLGQ
ncbi:MAG: LCP family protein [Anaerolineae bacterium]|nr:LCP family protein [Anaerolineae bacterium]MCI0608214.1 LCP family protein [Anaerolineae bacterium]